MLRLASIGLLAGCSYGLSPLGGDPADGDTDPVIDAPDSDTDTSAGPENAAPIADAGADLVAAAGTVVQLDGTGSADPDGDVLAWRWSFTTAPPESAAAILNDFRADPQFYADVAGSYVVELVVDDGELTDSDTVTVTVEEPNEAPIADAGSNQRVNVGAFVQLDGSGSWDPEDDALVYSWTLTARPTTSLATLAGASTVSPSFTADAAGTYTVELIVGDGQFDSVPATVTISAETASDGGCGSCADAVQAELRRRAPGSRAATWGLALLPLLAFAVQRRR